MRNYNLTMKTDFKDNLAVKIILKPQTKFLTLTVNKQNYINNNIRSIRHDTLKRIRCGGGGRGRRRWQVLNNWRVKHMITRGGFCLKS